MGLAHEGGRNLLYINGDVITIAKETVAAIIVRGEREKIEILLTRRNIEPFKGWWCLPGGHVDPGEEPVAAAVREVKEEVGLAFTPVFFGCFDEDIPSLNHKAHVSVFSGTASGEAEIDPGEVQAAQWFSPAEALALNLAFIHREVLEAFFKGGA